MERVFAARVIQLGVYHRALGGKEGVGEKINHEIHTCVCIFLGERLNGTDTNVHISHPL